MTSYDGNPVLKGPTWKAWIPSYFYLGGLAGAASLIAAGADAIGDARTSRVARLTALGAISAGAGALVVDLGKPARFHHMLRVFRPSSPMNVGSWLLAAYGPAVGASALFDSRTATWGAAALGPAVATYTAVLVSDTAVPAWHDARATMPAVFAAGAAASAGGVVAALAPHSDAATRVAIGGALAETALISAAHRSLPDVVGRAYTQARAGTLTRAAQSLLLGGALLSGAGRRRIGGALIAAGALAERFAVIEAGRASAADPAATVVPQRARLSAGIGRAGRRLAPPWPNNEDGSGSSRA